jgi:hypothetical protein
MPSGVYVRTEKHSLIIKESRKLHPHKPDCHCGVCKAIRGEYKGSGNPMFGTIGELSPNFGKPKPAVTGENSSIWKGDNALPVSIHFWIRYHWGKADHCDNFNCLGNSNHFEWSNKKKHVYTRNREDYQQLCRTCHRQYDLGKLIL